VKEGRRWHHGDPESHPSLPSSAPRAQPVGAWGQQWPAAHNVTTTQQTSQLGALLNHFSKEKFKNIQ